LFQLGISSNDALMKEGCSTLNNWVAFFGGFHR
jgi:hypothetical protein